MQPCSLGLTVLTISGTTVGCSYMAKNAVHYALAGLNRLGVLNISEKAKERIEKTGFVIGGIIGILASIKTQENLIAAQKFAAQALQANRDLIGHAKECFLKWGILEEKFTLIGQRLLINKDAPIPITAEELRGFGLNMFGIKLNYLRNFYN